MDGEIVWSYAHNGMQFDLDIFDAATEAWNGSARAWFHRSAVAVVVAQKQGVVYLLISKQQILLWMKVGQKDASDSEELLTQCLQLRQNLKCSCAYSAQASPRSQAWSTDIHSLCSHSPSVTKPEDPKPMDTKPEKPEESMRNCLRFPVNRPLSLRGARMGKTLGVVQGGEILCGSQKSCSLVREFTRCHCFRLVNYYYVSFPVHIFPPILASKQFFVPQKVAIFSSLQGAWCTFRNSSHMLATNKTKATVDF